MSGDDVHRVVVIGGGFGGVQAVDKLRRAPVDVTLIDRRNFHLFQPLTYQVATGALSPGDIAYPLRAIFTRDQNIRVLVAEASRLDLAGRQVHLRSVGGVPAPELGPVRHVDRGRRVALLLLRPRRVERARRRGEVARERAGRPGPDPGRLRGRRGEIRTSADAMPGSRSWSWAAARPASRCQARSPSSPATRCTATSARSIRAPARILLVEAGDRLLASFPPSLSRKAQRSLERIGVTPMLHATVVDLDGESVTIERGDQGGKRERIPTRTIVWAAGVTASSLASGLSELTGAELDRAGRITVEPDLTLPGHPEVFALGDMVRVRSAKGDVKTYPGVAPVAMQQGRYAAKVVRARLSRREHLAVSLHRQGQPGHDRARRRGGRHQGPAAQRLSRLDHVGVRPPLVPGWLQQSVAGLHAVVDQLLQPRAGGPVDHPQEGAEPHERDRG